MQLISFIVHPNNASGNIKLNVSYWHSENDATSNCKATEVEVGKSEPVKDKEWLKYMPRKHQSDVPPDLRMHGRVLQLQISTE